MERVRKLALVTTFATFFLISVGGLVRAVGAGLGCPDWPFCYGKLIPPVSADQLDPEQAATFNAFHTWVEYINRLIGVVIGVLILLTFVAAWRRARHVPAVFRPITAAVVFVGITGFLGGMVVKGKLDPRLVTIHFVFALLTVACLIRATLETYGNRLARQPGALPAETRRHRLWARIALAATSIQFLLGAMVRGTIDLTKKADPDLARDQWLAQVGPIDIVHRQGALAVTALVLFVAWKTLRAQLPPITWLQRTTRFTAACVLAQVLVGITLAYLGLPAWAQFFHVTFGAWIIGGLYLQTLLYDRTPQTAPAPSTRVGLEAS